MTTRDLILYSFGNRAAIERIARSSTAFWAGLVLVATAGIARNYDHHLLSWEWQWLAGPIGVSLISSIFIFWGICVMAGTCKGFWRQWRSFLGLFWLTAPMAWIYAIPVERFCDIRCATLWNLGFLLVVSLWRVALITRVVQVLLKVPVGQALGAVLGPASLEFLLGSYLHLVHQSLSITQIMGGIAPTEDERFLLDMAELVNHAALGVFVLGALLGILALVKKRQGDHRPALPPVAWTPFTPRGMIVLAAVFAAWLLAAVPAQLEIWLHRRVQWHFYDQEYTEAFELLAQHQPGDFPPAYPIPPTDSLFRLVETTPHLRAEHPPWLQDLYRDQVADALGRLYRQHDALGTALTHLAGLPGSEAWVRKNRAMFLKAFSHWRSQGAFTKEQLETFRALGIDSDEIPQRGTR